jgi:hypothetical protein
MSNTQTPATLPQGAIAPVIPPTDLPKFNAWGKMGLAVGARELALQAEQQLIAATLLTPTVISDVPAAEEALKTAKFKLNGLVEKRKEITSKLDAVTNRMMEPEKALTTAIANNSAAIIKVKQDDRTTQQQAAGKNAERIALRELIATYTATRHGMLRTQQIELIANAYVYALANVPPEELETYLPKVSARVTVATCTIPPPVVTPVLLTPEEVAIEVADLFTPHPPQDYIDTFALVLKEKFSDYAIAWANKGAAMHIHNTQLADIVAGITEDAEASKVEARLDAISTPVITTTPGVRDLKQVYEVDMSDDFDSAIKVLSACVAHASKVRECTRTTKWDSFGVLTIKRALAKIKSDDNDFNPAGIGWKVVDKL